MTQAPLTYLTSAGPRAAAVVPLTWFALAMAILTCTIFLVLVIIGMRRAVARGGAAETVAVPVTPGSDGIRWITTALWLSAIPVTVGLVWTMVVLGQTGHFPPPQPITLEVTARQWWWEIRYVGERPSDIFVTANEIHIPVGERVLVRLRSADVIHSFWVPQLSGKTDLIPGQRNLTWIAADAPGRYRGQCAEFCGAEHGRMGLEVVAEPREQFEAWRRAQLRPAAPPQTDAQHRGELIVESHVRSATRCAAPPPARTPAPTSRT